MGTIRKTLESWHMCERSKLMQDIELLNYCCFLALRARSLQEEGQGLWGNTGKHLLANNGQ